MDLATNELEILLDRLSLPKESFTSLSFCGTNKEELAAYLAALPHSSPPELCNRLYRLLPEIAGLSLPEGRKLAMMDMVEPEAFDCVKRLTKNIVVTPGTTKVLSLSIAMLRYLAQGYKSVLVKTLKFPASPPHLILHSIYGAIDVLNHVLAICWESYIPVPKSIWLELHTLYRIARMRGLETIGIKSEKATSGIEATIKSAYAKPLLLACTDPSRYAPRDIRQTLTYLTSTANLVDFVDRLQEGIFVIDTQSDQGPIYNFKSKGTTNRHFRLRTYRLVRHIEDKIASGNLNGLSNRLARDLCKYWSNEIMRQSDHVQEQDDVTLILGLSAIHRQVTGAKNASTFVDDLKNFDRKARQPLSLSEISDASEENRGTFISRKSDEDIFHKQHKAIEFKTPAPPQSHERLYKGRRINHSDSGACIEFDNPSDPLTPGELIGYRLHESEDWKIGIVRWVRITPKLQRRIGVQLIDGDITACAISQVTAGSSGELQHYPALMFEQGASRSIILPIMAFKAHITARLRSPTGSFTVKIGLCQEETYHIGRFSLELLNN